MPLRDTLGKLADGSPEWEATSEDLGELLESDVIDDGLTSYDGDGSGLNTTSIDGQRVIEADDVRGRHVGRKALALIQRFPLVGLKYLGASEELTINDDQPPPQTGNYAVAPLGISTLEYDGVKQNHLLVTFRAGQLTGFGMEDNYYAQSLDLTAGASNYPIDVTSLLKNRSGRSLVLNYNRNIQVKFNSTTSAAQQLYAVQSPYIIDLGLNIRYLYISAVNDAHIDFQVW